MTMLPLVAAALLSFSGSSAPVLSSSESGALVPAAAPENEFQKLVAEKAVAIVTIKFVMKVEMPGMGGDQEFEQEVFGVMMDPKGLVLVSNVQMGGMASRMGGGGGMSITPTQIKVMVGDDTEGVEAKLVTRDSDLDLAWVKIDKAPEKPYGFVDFSKAVEPKLGETLLYLDRMDKFFDRVPLVVETKVGAVAKKPRPLFLPADEGRRYGVPVFGATGQTVGFAALQLPNEDDAEGGGMGMNRFRGAVVILPAAEVMSATERAMKNPEGTDGKPAEGAKPASGAGESEAPAKDAEKK